MTWAEPGGWQWAVYTVRMVVGCVHWEDGGGLCTVGGKRLALYTGRMVVGRVQWEAGDGLYTLGVGWRAVYTGERTVVGSCGNRGKWFSR